jgi:hypothetical protein
VGGRDRKHERQSFAHSGYCARGFLHPHVHCIVPAGGFSSDYKGWVRPKYAFFLPVAVLGSVFRAKFAEGLRRAHRRAELRFCGPTNDLRNLKRFDAFIDSLFNKDWVVYAKPAFGGPTQVLRYIGRYTHRVAISNHRLLSFDGNQVTFRWRDYARRNKQREMTLDSSEFLRRFVEHVLPRGFVRIRHFGYLANAHRSPLLVIARQILAATHHPREPSDGRPRSTWKCPRCAAEMHLGPNLSPILLLSRCRALDTS